ncbi:Crp/Fnr family transcriptional regulator [Enterovibrio baiacu]|uniref:Crp/Fnr family transcriptional regulator n=1 Tax=Enterovibrio baiacu TaxID=2491023 RepID=UPI003D0E8D70
MSLQAQSSLYHTLLALPCCRPFRFHVGETFLTQGETSHSLYLVNDCDFSVSYLTPTGKRYIVSSQKGFTGVLGEMEVCRPEGRYVFSVTALSSGSGFQISRQKLIEALAADPNLALTFIQLVSARYEESIGHTLNNLLYSLRFNIIRHLMKKSESAKGDWFEFKTDQHAGELGSTPRAFRRVMKDLVDEGVIDKKRTSYRVAMPDALTAELEAVN